MNKIPEGTQYIESGCGEKGFRKYEKGCWWFFEGYWRHVDWKMGDLIPVSEHPFYVVQPDAWNGEGLPPAETVVELRAVSARTDWARAKIKFASGNVVVWDWVGQSAVNGLCSAYAHAIEMRPVRTAEQIATDELREKYMPTLIELWNEDTNRSDFIEAVLKLIREASADCASKQVAQ
ncbi:hypothetical protein V2J79_05190 [Pseudomonas alliivorans]|nr:hypothetical protein [Pseudomonas alliivorans]